MGEGKPIFSPLRGVARLGRPAFSNIEYAYDATQRMLRILRPDVLLVCQSGTQWSDNSFARTLSSSVSRFGNISLHPRPDTKEMIVIHAFHPMHARYVAGEDQIVGRVRRAALRFAFLQAVNILNGHFIQGPGVKQLQDALYGASQTPLLQNGNLDRSVDHRFQGVFLSPRAKPEFRRRWKKMMAENKQKVSPSFL